MESFDPAMQEAMLDEARRQNRMLDETARLKAELAEACQKLDVIQERAGGPDGDILLLLDTYDISLGNVESEIARVEEERGRLADLVDIYQGRAWRAEAELAAVRAANLVLDERAAGLVRALEELAEKDNYYHAYAGWEWNRGEDEAFDVARRALAEYRKGIE